MFFKDIIDTVLRLKMQSTLNKHTDEPEALFCGVSYELLKALGETDEEKLEDAWKLAILSGWIQIGIQIVHDIEDGVDPLEQTRSGLSDCWTRTYLKTHKLRNSQVNL